MQGQALRKETGKKIEGDAVCHERKSKLAHSRNARTLKKPKTSNGKTHLIHGRK
jgi:hypothetical protein